MSLSFITEIVDRLEKFDSFHKQECLDKEINALESDVAQLKLQLTPLLQQRGTLEPVNNPYAENGHHPERDLEVLQRWLQNIVNKWRSNLKKGDKGWMHFNNNSIAETKVAIYKQVTVVSVQVEEQDQRRIVFNDGHELHSIDVSVKMSLHSRLPKTWSPRLLPTVFNNWAEDYTTQFYERIFHWSNCPPVLFLDDTSIASLKFEPPNYKLTTPAVVTTGHSDMMVPVVLAVLVFLIVFGVGMSHALKK